MKKPWKKHHLPENHQKTTKKPIFAQRVQAFSWWGQPEVMMVVLMEIKDWPRQNPNRPGCKRRPWSFSRRFGKVQQAEQND